MPHVAPHSTTSASPTHPPPRPPRGFTIVEIIIATTVLSVGILSLAGAASAIMRLEYRGELLSRGASAAETRLELLRAQGCLAESGTSIAGGSIESWTVSHLSAGLYEIVDSVSYLVQAPGHVSRSQVYRSAARC